MSLLLIGHSRHCRVAIIITQFLADNLHYNTLFKIYQQPQATQEDCIRFCNWIENCPGNEDYLTWFIRLLRCYAMFDKRYRNIEIDMYPICNQAQLLLLCWHGNVMVSVVLRCMLQQIMMRVTANYQYAASIVYKIWVW